MLFPNSRGNEAVANQSLTKPLNIGSLGGMATASAAVKPTKKVELQLALNINFKFTGKLIPVMSSFNVLSQLLNWKPVEGDVFKKKRR